MRLGVEAVCVGKDVVIVLPAGGRVARLGDVEGPQDPCDGQEQRVFGQQFAWAYPPSLPRPARPNPLAFRIASSRTTYPAEGRVAVAVRVGRRAVLRLQVALGHEVVRVAEVLLVVVNGPQVAQHGGALGDEVAVVVVVAGAGVRRAAHHGNWPPAQRLGDDGAAVGQEGLVGPGRHAVAADDAVELVVCAPGHVRKAGHGEHEAHQSGRRRVAAGAEQRAGGVGDLALRQLARVSVEPFPQRLCERGRGIVVGHAPPHLPRQVEQQLRR